MESLGCDLPLWGKFREVEKAIALFMCEDLSPILPLSVTVCGWCGASIPGVGL